MRKSKLAEIMRILPFIILGFLGWVATNVLIYLVHYFKQRHPTDVIQVNSSVSKSSIPIPNRPSTSEPRRCSIKKLRFTTLESERNFNNFVKSYQPFTNTILKPDKSNTSIVEVLPPIEAIASFIGGSYLPNLMVSGSLFSPRLRLFRN